jgi:hypothetical protein
LGAGAGLSSLSFISVSSIAAFSNAITHKNHDGPGRARAKPSAVQVFVSKVNVSKLVYITQREHWSVHDAGLFVEVSWHLLLGLKLIASPSL